MRQLPVIGGGVATAVETSEDSKIGTCHATYASQRSCPTCRFKDAGCYGEHGHVAFTTRRLNNGTTPEMTSLDIALYEAEAITKRLSGSLDLRLHVVGDCSTAEAAQVVSQAALDKVRRRRSIWTYTHAWREVDRAAWQDVAVLASCEAPHEANAAMDQGYAVAVVVPEFQSNSRYQDGEVEVIPCPAQTRKVQCVDCRLCFDDTRLLEKRWAIGFQPHGSRYKNVQRFLHTCRETGNS